MKECLQCQKEFEPLRESNKFCNNYCRGKWHRANPKPKTKEEKITEVKLQVLYNSLLEMVGDFKAAKLSIPITPTTQSSFDSPKQSKTWTDELGQWAEPKEHKATFQELLNGMVGLQFGDDKEDYAQKIREATHLSEKQVKLLLGNLWSM